MDVDKAASEQRLRRELGVVLGVAITVNAMIGTGIFRLSPKVLALAGSSHAALAAWTLGGIISLAGALCIGALGAAMPRTGGIYEFLRQAYGPTTAFVFGWARLVLLGPSAAGGFARLAAIASTTALGLTPDPVRETWVAIGVLVLCTLTNLSGVRTSTVEQAIITALKYVGTVGLALACLCLPLMPAPDAAPTAMATATAPAFFAALVSVMWAFDGWGDLAALGGEVRNPARTMLPAVVIGTSSVTALYLLVNLGYERALGVDGILAAGGSGELIATNAIAVVGGELGRRALAALIFTSCVGACMVGVLTGSRVFVAMASDGLFFRSLGEVAPRSGTPTRAVMLLGAVGVAYISVRSFEQLADSFIVGAFPFYMLAVFGIFRLRRDPEIGPKLRVPLHPASTLLFLAGAAAVLVGALSDVEGITLYAFLVLLAGVPIGLVWQRASAQRAPKG